MAKAASKSSPQRKYFLQPIIFAVLYISCTATPEMSSQNTNSTVRVSRLSFPFLWYDYASSDDEHWHITIEQLMQAAHIYTLSVVQTMPQS